MKRRIFAVILSCLMVLSLIPFAAFAADEHKHSYTSTTVIEASCTTTGIKKLVCACGDTKYEAIPKHTLDAGVVLEEATCTKAGSVEKTCLVCSEKVVEEVKAFGHLYVETVKPATCARPALVGEFCTRCGEQKPETTPQEIGEKVDHFYKDNAKFVFDNGTADDKSDDVAYSKATCAESGYEFKPCIYCGKLAEEIAGDKTAVEILAVYYVEAAGHKWNKGVVAPGKCELEGCNGFTHTIYTCTVCGGKTIDLATEKDVPSDAHAANHDYVKKTTKATCVKDGKEVYTCSHCGDSYTIVLEKSGHNFDLTAEPLVKAATCTTTGYYYWLCKNGCKTEQKKVDDKENVIVIEIDPTNHGKNKTTGEVMVPHSCTSSGIEKLFCTGCNAFIGYGPIAAKHTEKAGTSVVKTEKTCTSDGLRTYECSACGKIVEEVIKASHNNKVEILEAATCTKAGTKLLTCLDCGVQQKETIKQLEHSYKKGYFAPDCENPGRTGEICTVCGTAKGTVTIHEDEPALGHKIKESVVPATCGVPTSVKRECTVCDYIYIEAIPGVQDALEHDVNDKIKPVHLEATCTQDEVDIYVCKRCGEFAVAKEGYEKAYGHDIKNDVHIEATCSTYGYIANICQNGCGLEENVRILNNEAPDGKTHIGVESKTDFLLAPDCITGASGIARVVCKLCGEYTTLNGSAYAVAPYAHNFADGQYVKEAATCTSNGVYGYKCTVCNIEANADQIAADELTVTIKAAHTYGSSVIISDTVCGGIIKERTCIVCSYVNQYVDKKGTGECTYETRVFAKTCTQDAYVADVCIHCNDQTNIQVIDDNDGVNGYYGVNHEKATNLVSQTKAATCVAAAQNQKYCTRCEKVVKSEPVGEPLGHSGVPTNEDDIFEVKATCEKGGCTFYICTKCDENVEITKSNKLPCALEEDAGYKTDKSYLTGKKTTCLDGGYYTLICKNCKKNVSDEVIFEASTGTEHSDVKATILTPDCDSKGIQKRTCKYCSRIEYDTLDIKHTWDAGVRVKDECSAKNNKANYVDCLFSCKLCDATKTEKAYKPHEYGSYTVTVEATCLPGSKYRVCKVCDYKQTTKIDPVAEHEFSEDDLYVPATCQFGIRIGVACVNCYTPKDKWAYVGAELAAHDTVETHVAADCETDEHFLVECKNCDYEQKITFEGGAKATGHTFVAGSYIYNGAGYHVATCSACGDADKINCYEQSKEIANMSDEDEFVLGEITKVDGNCQQGAHYVFDCLVCREVGALVADNENYPITGDKVPSVHAYDVKTIILAPSCATAGIYRLTCSCEAENVPVKYAPAPKLPTHTYGEQLTSAGKYTTMYEVCSVCEYINVVFTTKETPLTDAEKNCLVGKHVSETVAAVTPTVCVDGKTAYTKCAHCDVVLTEGKVVAAPHQYKVVSEGFDANGEYVVMYQCELCDKTKVDVH